MESTRSNKQVRGETISLPIIIADWLKRSKRPELRDWFVTFSSDASMGELQSHSSAMRFTILDVVTGKYINPHWSGYPWSRYSIHPGDPNFFAKLHRILQFFTEQSRNHRAFEADFWSSERERFERMF